MVLSKKTVLLLFLITVFSFITRFTWIGNFPNALYPDEIDQGYNAYSILKTGKDEHGMFLPVSLRSFGDWKPPLPTYLMIPFIGILGLTEESVRLPSVVLGVATIFLTFALVRLVFKDHPSGTKIALISALLLSLSPWHILHSRAAMLVIIGLFFLESGIYLFLKSLEKKIYLVISAAFFSLSVYSYYGLRLIVPLLVIFLFFLYKKQIVQMKKELILSTVVTFILIIPFLRASIIQQDVLLGRARTISIFYDQGIALWRKELITQEEFNTNTKLISFFHNKPYLYLKNIIQRYLSHLELKYLFFEGDKAPPFKLPSMGILYIQEAILLLVGLFTLFSHRDKDKSLIIAWLLLGILPASLTFITPSSNRTFNSIVPMMIISGLGIWSICRIKRLKYLIVTLIVVSYILTSNIFLQKYFVEIPQKYPDWWGYRLSKLGKTLSRWDDKVDKIAILNDYNMIYPYILFYQRYDPHKFQQEVVRTYVEDQFGFEHIESFGKYIIYNDKNWEDLSKSPLSDTLYVIPYSMNNNAYNVVDLIKNPNGETAYELMKTNK